MSEGFIWETQYGSEAELARNFQIPIYVTLYNGSGMTES